MADDVDSDFYNLQQRLRYLATDADEPLVFVLGSGMSIGAIPNVSEMTSRFLQVLTPGVQQKLQERWREDDTAPALRYQQAALTVGTQRGDKALGTAIRAAVLDAFSGPKVDPKTLTSTQAKALLDPAHWNIPKAHSDFASFVSNLPRDLCRAVITTNFDPLIEVALARAGMSAHALPIPFDDAPSIDQMRHDPSVSVMHIHGYFADQWSQNSIRHIAGARPNLQGLLSSLVSGATVVVIGYGGWEDTFMQVLSRHAAQRTILNAQVIWCAYSASATTELDNPIIQDLRRGPGFDLYTGIDASQIFELVERDPAPVALANAPAGWTTLPISGESTSASRKRFVDGGAPTWSDAATDVWPQFSTTRSVSESLRRAFEGKASPLKAIIGPTGEGKTTALRQIAAEFARESDSISVYWRESTAPPIRDWLQSESRAELGRVLLCIDEADLARDDLIAIRDAESTDPDLFVIAACQDRLWWRLSVAKGDDFDTYVFGGVDSTDADSLAKSWVQHGLIAGTRLAGKSTHAIAEELATASAAARSARSSTLFGAILEVRDAEGLQARVDDLMQKLFTLRLADRPGDTSTLGDIFAMICLLEVKSKIDALGGGASRQLVAEAARAANSLQSVAIMRALGREASVTFAGDFVYSRHPRIAEAAIDWLRRNGKYDGVCAFAARAGGRMKQAQAFDRRNYQDAYMLARSLESGSAAQAAARAAIEAAPSFMEPRITYLSVVRRFDLAAASLYASKVIKALPSTLDASTSVRVLLNELAIVDNAEGRHLRAVGLVGLMLNNGTGSPITREQLGYAFGTLAQTLGYLSRAGRLTDGMVETVKVATSVAEALLAPDVLDRHVLPPLASIGIRRTGVKGSLSSQLDRLSTDLTPFARRAITDRKLPFATNPSGDRPWMAGRIDIGDLTTFA